LAILTVGALITVACGGQERPASTELTVTQSEFQFSPNVWRVPAGEQVSIEITNAGTVPHQWILLQGGVRIDSEEGLPDADFAYAEEEVAAGETATLTFEAPPAGTYQVICAIPTHFDSGMEGTLTSA
jgi:uncharacterized cupredoxin-like copper-binding protein